MRTIVTVTSSEESMLRARADEVQPEDIQSHLIQNVILDMKEALSKEKFGVAIAAPQVGELLRIFVVRGKVFASRSGDEYDEDIHKDQTFINPEVVKVSKKIKTGDEGCLSIPGKYGTRVDRYDKITIRYFDEFGERHERGASGFLARVFQHEIDHLNGILYTDIATEVISVDDDLKPIA
ncbi:peptide deformylase [bacterium]|nr:peptide deformylase [bacterium]|tara:strand:+ start:16540 stop:17079 length:540 start_codon:yes stop_codon:yes gene_type:complete